MYTIENWNSFAYTVSRRWSTVLLAVFNTLARNWRIIMNCIQCIFISGRISEFSGCPALGIYQEICTKNVSYIDF
jgi:hypothetical protein